MNDKISVIVPVYNTEKYMEKCLDSIINQSYDNLEIIIINDGSTDNSGMICDKYKSRDDRIIVIHQENQGLSIARNNGLDIATGDYIGFVDSDDWIESDMFSTLYTGIVKNDAEIAVCNFYYIKQDGRTVIENGGDIIFNENNSITETILENDDKLTHYFTYTTYDTVAWNKLYKKELFDGIRYPPNKVFEDLFTTHKLIGKANRVVILPDYKYYYLYRDDSITKKRFDINQFDRVEACIDRYNYISYNYKHFEMVSRRFIFYGLLFCINIAIKDNVISKYKKEIDDVIKKVSSYSVYNCGLSEDEEKIITLLFSNLRRYILGTKIANQKFLHKFYEGDSVYCPCCDRSFSKFKNFYIPKSHINENFYKTTPLDVICPNCNSLPRHRILCDYLEHNKQLALSQTLLFAPSPGYELWFKKNKLNYISADLYNKSVDLKIDIQDIPFNDEKIDFISCDHVLEHVADYKLALKELFRVIKTGGIVEITVPIQLTLDTTYEDPAIKTPADRFTFYGQDDHLRLFGRDFIDNLFKVGFNVTICDGDNCDPKIIPITGPASYDYNKIFICKK